FQDFSLNDLIKIIKNEPLLYEPGTSQEYSNSGYVVLGAVIEKITGKSYERNLTERIITPLKLKNMYYTKTDKEKQMQRAFGTDIDFEGKKKSRDDISNSTPAGGIYTCIDDLLKFSEAKMKSILPSRKKYGNGMFAGGTPFWNSTICYNGGNGYAFVVMTNTGNIADEIALRLNSIIKGKSYPPLELPFKMSLYKIIQENGFDYVKTNIEKLAEQAGLPYDDRFLNFFGYQFQNAGKREIALNLFKMNVELFPDVANTYDSLAEAYLNSGDKTNALKYYEMVLERDPENSRVRKVVQDLQSGK
ncbi:MAG: serine hydrolase, partial [Ignavibacteriales bacterium]|nr:serine hydrolase [Ignavibacteriales bacterium]